MELGQAVDAQKCLTQEMIMIYVYGSGVKEIFNDVVEPDYERGSGFKGGITLNDCLEIAKNEMGYECGVITVIAESYLGGAIYRYGNYQDGNWYLVGTMMGFA